MKQHEAVIQIIERLGGVATLGQLLCLNFDLEVFNTDEVNEAQAAASESGGTLYCWKTSGISNWLEKGLSISDVLGIVVLPQGLSDQIDMPDDEADE